MLKILWVCNLSVIKTKRNTSYWCGGWMTSTAGLLAQREDIELFVCYPQSDADVLRVETKRKIHLCGFYVKNINEYDPKLETVFGKIDKLYEPDAVTIFGTEYPHSLSAIRVWRKKAIVSIQGLIGIYAQHYFSGIPTNIVCRKQYRNGKIHSIYHDMLRLKKRGMYEQRTLKYAKYVSGRTEWDYACACIFNEKAHYFSCNRILRSSFYDGKWEHQDCNKYSILISQADYPVKGFHIFLKALNLIKRKYPDVKVIVAGRALALEKKNRDSYGRYIAELLEKYQLRGIVKFIGAQSEERMKKQFLKANVFVLPSLIENSPNSLGEAMILGVPAVASDVGGVSGMMEHGKEGFIYQADAEYMLAHYVERIFEDENLAKSFSEKARVHALKTHDREKNLKTILQMYSKIAKQG